MGEIFKNPFEICFQLHCAISIDRRVITSNNYITKLIMDLSVARLRRKRIRDAIFCISRELVGGKQNLVFGHDRLIDVDRRRSIFRVVRYP